MSWKTIISPFDSTSLVTTRISMTPGKISNWLKKKNHDKQLSLGRRTEKTIREQQKTSLPLSWNHHQNLKQSTRNFLNASFLLFSC